MGLLGAIAGGLTGFAGDLYQGHLNRKHDKAVNAQNAELQRQFAQMGITWRVQDAQRAGIHPLAALGASGASASPSYQIGSSDNAYSNLGQNLSRAMGSTMNSQDRIETKLRNEHLQLQNDFLRAQINSINNTPQNPPMPTGGTDNFIGGQGDSGTMLVVPAKRTSHAPGRPAQEAGARPDVSYSRTDTGLVPVIPEGLSESMEDDTVGKILWRIRNQIQPNFGLSRTPPKSQLPPWSREWRWDTFSQEWQPAPTYYGKGKSIGRKIWDNFRYR